MTPPVTAKRIAIAGLRLKNASAIALACRDAKVPYFWACALVEQESTDGSNIYGHDAGGTFTIKGDKPVTDKNFFEFIVKVMNGAKSNGVGPLQITFAGKLVNGHRDGGYFRQMADQGRRPWVPAESIAFGLDTLHGLFEEHGSWELAAAHYNGGTIPDLEYGGEVADKASAWKARFGI